MPNDGTDSDAPNLLSLELPLNLEHALLRAGVRRIADLAQLTASDLVRLGLTVGELEGLRATLLSRDLVWADEEQLELPSDEVTEHALSEQDRNIAEQAELGLIEAADGP